jgi:hypothetical protein
MKDQPQPQPAADDRAYEKDSRFIEFIKNRYESSFDRSKLLDGHKVMDELMRKYGLGEYKRGL